VVPVVFRERGHAFFFYSNEGDPREPIHIHVRSAEGNAKVWVEPSVAIASSHGFNARTLAVIVSIVEKRAVIIRNAWHAHFGL
jgi:hypothetical protein